MEDKKAKGSMLIDFIRMIRTFKDLDWNKYLKQEDWDIVNSIVLPAKWYPFDFYYRCSFATYKLLAQGKLENARAYGQAMAKQLLEGTYKSFVQSKDAALALKQFVTAYGGLFNFGVLKLESNDPKSAKVHLDYDGDKEGKSAYSYQLMGMIETLIALAGGKNGKVSISAKQWEGAPATTFDITWV